MSKIEQNKNVKKTQFAENLDEELYSQWIREQFLKEAEEIESELGEIPDSEDWQPTEEKFQALMKKVKEQELSKNLADSLTSTVDSNKKIKENTKEKEIQAEELPEKIKYSTLKKKVIKWSVAAAATIIVVFAASMTIEASRAYIMEEVNKLFGKGVNTEVDNDDVLDSDRTEEYARTEIGKTLQLSVPIFHYMPSGMKYQDYVLDEEAHTAYIQYSWDEWMIYFRVFSNIETASRLSQSDIGKEIEGLSSDLTANLNITLWEIQEEGDKKPTYSLQWEYKNSYYELFGKLPKEEMENIAKKIMY